MKRSTQHNTTSSTKRQRQVPQEDMNCGSPSPPEEDERDDVEASTDVDEQETKDIVPEEDEELVRAATDVIEGMVLRLAGNIVSELKASYDMSVYSDVLYATAYRGVSDLKLGMCIERNAVVPIQVKGRVYGSIKVPFLFTTTTGRPLLAMEVKTKRTPLKDADMDTLRCAVEQLGIQQARIRGTAEMPLTTDIPRAMVLNFSGGVQSSMVMQCDGTVSN